MINNLVVTLRLLIVGVILSLVIFCATEIILDHFRLLQVRQLLMDQGKPIKMDQK